MLGKVAESQKLRVPGDLRNAVSETVSRSQDYFVNSQAPEGYWWGELESNATMEAEYLLLTHFLGIGDRETWRKLANHLFNVQRDDGTWGQYYGAPGDLSTTVECYFALKLSGVSAEDPRLVKARTVHPAEGWCSADEGLYQGVAGAIRSVELEARTRHSTRDGAVAIVVPDEPVRLLELGARHDAAAEHRVLAQAGLSHP